MPSILLSSTTRSVPSQCHLLAATYPHTSSSRPVKVEGIATTWIIALNQALQNKDFDTVGKLFFEESYWRDQLCLSWDYHTMHGPQGIKSFFEHHPKGSRLRHVSIDDSDLYHMPKIAPIDHNRQIWGVQASLKIETDVGTGKGLVRLVEDEKSKIWKAFTFFTAMYELKDHIETVKHRRPPGFDHRIPGDPRERKNWHEKRIAQENFQDDFEPTVLIIGEHSQ